MTRFTGLHALALVLEGNNRHYGTVLFYGSIILFDVAACHGRLVGVLLG
jgi:hypothetical protein